LRESMTKQSDQYRRDCRTRSSLAMTAKLRILFIQQALFQLLNYL